MSNILTNQIRTSPGPSEIEKELIKRMEGQNFQNASGMIPRDNHRLNSENVIQTGPKSGPVQICFSGLWPGFLVWSVQPR